MIGPHAVTAELVAVLVAVTEGTPRVLLLEGAVPLAPLLLPSGPFEGADRSLQSSIRAWLGRRTGQMPLYLEQLYTFADRDRLRPSGGDDGGLRRVISVSYLALAREGGPALAREGRGSSAKAGWHDWYDFFPWEDRRVGTATAEAARRALRPWIGERSDRLARADLLFGPARGNGEAAQPDGDAGCDEGWDEDGALARYELLHEAGLVAEAGARAGAALGVPLGRDHRRILATAIARLRAKIRYRALVFELMPPSFTLLELQTAMEGLAGRRLHKGNFRRLVAAQDLIEETGETARAGGRPARFYRFRGARLAERALGATRLPRG